VLATERCAGNGEYVWDAVVLDRFGKKAAAWTGLRLKDVGPLPRTEPWPAPLLAVYLERSALALGLHPDLRVTITREGMGVTAPCRVACGWRLVGQRPGPERPSSVDPDLERLVAQLRTALDESAIRTTARVRAVQECLSKSDHLPDGPIRLAGIYDGGWVRLDVGTAMLASAVVRVAGVDTPVAVAILTDDQGAAGRA
jgi:enediyne polyketide synthase